MTLPTLPLTVIGGYLGVGKTTLINRLLADRGAVRMAVLVNDFGELNIDAQLIAQASSTTIALTNGCVCCAIGDDLGAALATLQEQPAGFDQVLLEASGVADPVKLGRMAETWPGYRLHGVAVLADAQRTPQLLKDRYVGAHVGQQLSGADLLLASKLDTLDALQQSAFLDWLRLQSGAPALTVNNFSVSMLQRRPAQVPSNVPHPRFQARTFRTSTPMERPHFDHWAHSLSLYPVRGKGFLRFREDPTTWLAQIVDGQITLTPAATPRRGCELVLIGRSLDTLPPPFAHTPPTARSEIRASDD